MSVTKLQSWASDDLDFLCRNCVFVNGYYDAAGALSRYLFIYLFIGVRLDPLQRGGSNTYPQRYVNVSVLIKFSQNTSVFTLIIISSP